jgi:hypothetical protein
MFNMKVTDLHQTYVYTKQTVYFCIVRLYLICASSVQLSYNVRS